MEGDLKNAPISDETNRNNYWVITILISIKDENWEKTICKKIVTTRENHPSIEP